MRNSRGWREQGDRPAAKESAGSVVRLFIILSLCDCDLWVPLWKESNKRGKRAEDRVRNRGSDTEREAVSLKKITEWEQSPPVQSRCQTVCRPPSTGLWDRPSLVKPSDSTGRAAVHWFSVLLLTAQMRDKQIPLFIYTWSTCVYHSCLLAFCVRVVFWWSPMTAIVLHGHHLLKFEASGRWWPSWGVLGACQNEYFFKRQLHFIPLIVQDCTWCLFL